MLCHSVCERQLLSSLSLMAGSISSAQENPSLDSVSIHGGMVYSSHVSILSGVL